MVAGLPGADRRALVRSRCVTSPSLLDSYVKCYDIDSFETNPSSSFLENGILYETSMGHLCVSDIVTILNDLIEEKL